MKNFTKGLIFAAAVTGFASAASASITVTVTPGTAIYTGPTPTYDFETPGTTAPHTGGGVVTLPNTSAHAQPVGSTGFYFSVGPTDGEPATIDLTSFADIFSISFIWGSVDSYNTLQFIDALGNPLAGGTFVGGDIFNPANGNQTDPNTNPLVTFHFTGADVANVAGIRMTSNGTNAFETDNYAINALPEPGTWAMMLLGFGAVGIAMRRRKAAIAQLA